VPLACHGNPQHIFLLGETEDRLHFSVDESENVDCKRHSCGNFFLSSSELTSALCFRKTHFDNHEKGDSTVIQNIF
jgi:hypothetical protein